MSESKPMDAGTGLRFIANYLDLKFGDTGKNDEVQQDCRKWAADYDALVAALAEAERKLESARAELAEAQQEIKSWVDASR